MKECVFCTKPEIKQRWITENELAYTFPTNIPITPGHVLICPKRCVARFDDLTLDERNAIFDLREKLKAALVKAFSATGFNQAWNEGKTAGQSVPHFHLHLLPRKEGDAGILEYEPRKFLYRPGSREPTKQDELAKVAQLIKDEL